MLFGQLPVGRTCSLLGVRIKLLTLGLEDGGSTHKSILQHHL